MSLLTVDIPQQPDRDARNKGKDLKEKIRGVKKHPVERKEKEKSHPDELHNDENLDLTNP